MRVKKIFFALLVFLVFAAGTVSALTLKAEKTGYAKGDEIKFSGSCSSEGGIHRIRAIAGNIKVFDEQINCFSGQFNYSYRTEFLDPSGVWEATLSSPTEEAKAIVRLDLTQSSAYYRITFLSPPNASFQKKERLFVAVEITDSGNPVENAEAVFFDPLGRKITLKGEGMGIYDANYEIPFDAKTGKWDLLVTARKISGAETFGSERKLEAEIIPANLKVEILEPTLKTFDLSDSAKFSVKVLYPNGTDLSPEEKGEVFILIGQEKTLLEYSDGGVYSKELRFPFSGSVEVEISAKDSAGNQGSQKTAFVVSCSATCWLKSYGLIAVVVVLVFALLGKLFYGKVKLSMDLGSLKAEREKTWQLVKDLQSEYFQKGVMPAGSYRSNLTSYRSKLIELDEKIKLLEKKIQNEK